jgi:hypothetical protein
VSKTSQPPQHNSTPNKKEGAAFAPLLFRLLPVCPRAFRLQTLLGLPDGSYSPTRCRTS